MAGTSIVVPQISQADMVAFHEAHFSKLATDHFNTHFLRPDFAAQEGPAYNGADDEEYYDEEEDDGLGHYPDGVKRTLTDEQIAIFRHSELEALRRAKESSNNTNMNETTSTRAGEDIPHDLSEGEVSSPTPLVTATTRKQKKRKRGKNNKNKHAAEQIDLRKRTWDVVDKGLESLEYDEEESEPSQAGAIQRRRISYDD
ncbi:hypothetical protein N656DRAFT_770149 [Canariomyces notabilis]|uniref:Uncharacterized protein n=1 Tax=Canariomyces notabilis TaxID=2074819 RepID=A0AAN6QHR2_9PEZI|nr:hypothetical protein N656DRAFT_770149 [Canariomyces arenarius]